VQCSENLDFLGRDAILALLRQSARPTGAAFRKASMSELIATHRMCVMKLMKIAAFGQLLDRTSGSVLLGLMLLLTGAAVGVGM
jgi:hypothetical protein